MMSTLQTEKKMCKKSEERKNAFYILPTLWDQADSEKNWR